MKVSAHSWYTHICLIDFIRRTRTSGEQWNLRRTCQVEMPVSVKNTGCLHSMRGGWSGKERKVVC